MQKITHDTYHFTPTNLQRLRWKKLYTLKVLYDNNLTQFDTICVIVQRLQNMGATWLRSAKISGLMGICRISFPLAAVISGLNLDRLTAWSSLLQGLQRQFPQIFKDFSCLHV